MAAELEFHDYGKSEVRLTKVTRHADRHDLCEISVAVKLSGDFAETYTTGDNRRIVATDSMRNTIYVLAKEHPLDSIESFGLHLTAHFIKKYSQVNSATATIRADRWERIVTNGKPHKHSFVAGSAEKRSSTVHRDRQSAKVSASIFDCEILKTTDSLFKDFVRDEFTTLPDSDDRIFATKLNAMWYYTQTNIDWNDAFAKVRQAMLDVFCEHYSLSVQQTLYAMGEAALAACPEIEKIELTLPNKHRIPFNLTPFGKENKNEIFVTTSEPYGEIHAVIARKK
jgi:urate oxidase